MLNCFLQLPSFLVHIPQIRIGFCQKGVLFNCQSAKVSRSGKDQKSVGAWVYMSQKEGKPYMQLKQLLNSLHHGQVYNNALSFNWCMVGKMLEIKNFPKVKVFQISNWNAFFL